MASVFEIKRVRGHGRSEKNLRSVKAVCPFQVWRDWALDGNKWKRHVHVCENSQIHASMENGQKADDDVTRT